MADTITAEKLKKWIKEGRGVTILDVRREADYRAAPQCIRGAVRQDPELVGKWISTIRKDLPAVVYCKKGGAVSRTVADRMKQREFDVRLLTGGLATWREADGPLDDLPPGA